MSNREIRGDQRHRDPLKKPISSANDENLKILDEIAEMARKMQGRQGKREKCFTRDTSSYISATHMSWTARTSGASS